MVDFVRKADYYYTEVAHKPGEGARILELLRKAGINLLAFSGFPGEAQLAQLDLIASDTAALKAACQKEGVKLVGPRTCFLIQGDDRVGAVADVLSKLGEAGISVTAFDAVAAGNGRYGGILWVAPSDVEKTGKVLAAAPARAEAFARK